MNQNQIDRFANWTAGVALAAVIASAAVAVVWGWNIDFKACGVVKFEEHQKAAIAELADMVKWILGLSVGLIGLFGSIAMGLREGPALSRAAWTFLIAAICCFGSTAYFALMWRTAVAQALFIGCPAYVAADSINFLLDALTWFFVAGVATLAIVLSLVSWQRTWSRQ